MDNLCVCNSQICTITLNPISSTREILTRRSSYYNIRIIFHDGFYGKVYIGKIGIFNWM